MPPGGGYTCRPRAAFPRRRAKEASPLRNGGEAAAEAPAAEAAAPPLSPFEGAEGLLARVGNTPLVRLARIPYPVLRPGVEIWAKLEGQNPGGSVKDRAALAMVLDARRRGVLREGMTILDASSGNTGIAYAMMGSLLGHKLCLCLPKNANAERKAMLRAFGAEIVETDPLEGSDGAIREARRRAAAWPERYVYLDQYGNAANWKAHYGSTGPEIWAQTQGRVTHFVASLGTSGTFVGTTRFLKEKSPSIRCVSVQPDSPFHGLEGLKHMDSSIVPPIYDRGLADEDVGAPTEAALELVRRAPKEEGLLIGVSSGAALWAALEIGRRLERGVVVTVFPDGGERYLSEPHVWKDDP
jgi:cysteine synthase B